MYKILENNLSDIDKNNFGNGKYLIQTAFTSQNQWYKTSGSSWSRKKLRPQLQTRKTTHYSQTRKIREAVERSRNSRIKEEEA